MRMREVLRVGASVASIGALALKVADTEEEYISLLLPLPDALRLGQA